MRRLTPPAGRRGSTEVGWADVAPDAEPPVVLEPLGLLLLEPPDVFVAELEGEAVWLAWVEAAADPWVAD